MNNYIDPAGFDIRKASTTPAPSAGVRRGFITGDAITAANIH